MRSRGRAEAARRVEPVAGRSRSPHSSGRLAIRRSSRAATVCMEFTAAPATVLICEAAIKAARICFDRPWSSTIKPAS
jgi:hypothetical protein